MSDLFEEYNIQNAPLPHRQRPRDWEGYQGQGELLEVIRARPVHSMILYGPPGCGKTTLANILARHTGLPYYELSAVSSGVKDLREVIEIGKQRSLTDKGVVLFIDEIHRFNKAQQDSLLHAVESGWIYLIGATTENPSFEVNGPLLSRCQVYRLLALKEEDMNRIIDRVFETEPGFAGAELSERARELLLEAGGGDARRVLRVLEACLADRTNVAEAYEITPEHLSYILQTTLRNYDKAGDNHYDFISAFIKSLRGSDPDAALTYMACMLEAGEDPKFIARRLIIFAAEDVGNAAPQGLNIALSAFQAVERIGMPEGRIVLAQAVTFLAACPKSNAAYNAINSAMERVKGHKINIPNHLRNAPTATHRAEGAGQGYQYPHNFPGHFVQQNYMPEGMDGEQFYYPTQEGQENKLRERLKHLRPGRRYE